MGEVKANMSSVAEQLAHLRQTVARIDQKYQAPALPRVPKMFIEELLTGEVVETALGQHFETEKVWALHQRHGSFGIADLPDLAPDLLNALADGAIPHAPPGSWAFLDTETTGLAGGSGTYAFLVGIGSIDADGFRVRQFFMRDFNEEPSLFDSLTRYLERFDVLITWNGKSYDQPLLETRYRMCRAKHPFGRMQHLDLLHGARRLFKLRLEDCRLVRLENEILGVERDEDIPGELIPYCYFEYLRSRRALRLVPVFVHNAIDILSLACLTGVIPEAFRDPDNAPARHGADLLGLARWLSVAGRLEQAWRVTRRAIDLGLADQHLFRALNEAGLLEKRLGRFEEAVETFRDLTISPNPFRHKAWEELAKHYEHREKNFSLALESARAARSHEVSAALENRIRRLEARCARPSRLAGVKKSRTKAGTKSLPLPLTALPFL